MLKTKRRSLGRLVFVRFVRFPLYTRGEKLVLEVRMRKREKRRLIAGSSWSKSERWLPRSDRRISPRWSTSLAPHYSTRSLLTGCSVE